MIFFSSTTLNRIKGIRVYLYCFAFFNQVTVLYVEWTGIALQAMVN